MRSAVTWCCTFLYWSFDHYLLTVDLTFSQGDFNVPTTYRHLLVKCKRTGHPPVMTGPTLIHYKKSFASYLFFASAMIGQCREIKMLCVFGTDGWKGLNWELLTHLTRFIHASTNIKEELMSSNISQDLWNKILDDIFGKQLGTTFPESLVDVTTETKVDVKLEILLSKLLKNEHEVQSFILWFITCPWLKNPCYMYVQFMRKQVWVLLLNPFIPMPVKVSTVL